MNPLTIKLLAGAVIIIGAFGAGWMVQGWRLNTEIAQIKAQSSDENAQRAQIAVSDLQADAALIHNAATEYANVQTTLGGKLDLIRKDLKNVQAKAPLPAGCAPDADRLRNLKAAVSAANEAAATR